MTTTTTVNVSDQPVEAAEKKTWLPLLPIDICDKRRCSAQAYVRVIHQETDNDLVYCKHHYEEVEDKFGDDWIVMDERAKLLVPVESSA